MEKGGTDKAKVVAALKQATAGCAAAYASPAARIDRLMGNVDPLEPALRQRDRLSPHARLEAAVFLVRPSPIARIGLSGGWVVVILRSARLRDCGGQHFARAVEVGSADEHTHST